MIQFIKVILNANQFLLLKYETESFNICYHRDIIGSRYERAYFKTRKNIGIFLRTQNKLTPEIQKILNDFEEFIKNDL